MKKHRIKKHTSHILLFYTIIAFLTIILSLTIRIVTNPQRINTKAQNLPSPTATQPPASPTSTPTPTPTPGGPVIMLELSLPGISSTGGTLNPKHQTREVTIFLFNTSDNAADTKVDPLYTSKTTLTYDDDATSPTYTKFTNSYHDLGVDIPEGDYQIALKTNQTLRTVVKNKPDDINGIFFKIYKSQRPTISDNQLVVGDIVPEPLGDNAIDIADYNALIDCFGTKFTEKTCIAKERADLDDNGTVDGVDYNLMLLTFRNLAALGFPIPTLSKAPTPTKPVKVKVTSPPATPAATQKASSGSPIGAILLFLVIAGLVGGGVFFFIKKRKKKQTPAETAQTEGTVSAADSITDKEYYLKKESDGEGGKGAWLTLTDDNGAVRGFYPNNDYQEGFVKISGILKKDDKGQQYIEISQITSEG